MFVLSDYHLSLLIDILLQIARDCPEVAEFLG